MKSSSLLRGLGLSASVLALIAGCSDDSAPIGARDDKEGPATAEEPWGDPSEPAVEPDAFAEGDTDVVTSVRTGDDRKAISPLIYGINNIGAGDPQIFENATFVRRGGDRANAYNWETNVSNGSFNNDFSNDMELAVGLDDESAPAGVDLALIRRNRASKRGTMVPFVLHEWVAGPLGGGIPYLNPGGWNRAQYFRKVELVKPTAFANKPVTNDGTVYTDEHLAYMKAQFPDDIYAPGPTQVIVGIDNEPDLYGFNFPMLQQGKGEAIYMNGAKVGNRVTGAEFIERYVKFTKRVRELAPTAMIVGPSHYHYDGWTNWHTDTAQWSSAGDGKWFMDDFLTAVRKASEASGKRLLDTWDFHWYPQHMFGDKFVWDLDDSVKKLTAEQIDAIVQNPRSYWDHDFDEDSWITRDHLGEPTFILERLRARLDTFYPGTGLGVSEYFPGGCAHISSGLGVADSLGIFGRMGVSLAAMWPVCQRLEYALGAFALMRNADGKGLQFAGHSVKVDHPEKVETSVYGAADDTKRVSVLVINKRSQPRRVGLRLFGVPKLAQVSIHRIDAAHASPTSAGNEMLTKTNAFAYEAPPMSASLLTFTRP